MRIFCSICKHHVELAAENEKDAMQKFKALGHDNRKVARMLRGPVGWYREPAPDEAIAGIPVEQVAA